jgi:Cytosol aminopeptidase family, N-terminal domain
MMTKQIRSTALVALICCSAILVGQSAPAQLEVPNATIPTHVLVQSPAETKTALQVICLFKSDPTNTLHGSLVEINEKLGGLLDQIRKPASFAGIFGETLLIGPPLTKMSAKQILIVGLGDSQSYTPERMELVGSIVYREASRLRVEHPFFAPTVLDGGVTGFSTGDTAAWFIRGFLRAAATEKQLVGAGASAGMSVRELTFLAGATHANDTRDGIVKAYTAAK